MIESKNSAKDLNRQFIRKEGRKEGGRDRWIDR